MGEGLRGVGSAWSCDARRMRLVLALLVMGCAGVEAARGVPPDVAADWSACVVGDRRACACADAGGITGLRECARDAGAGEIWGPCVCP